LPRTLLFQGVGHPADHIIELMVWANPQSADAYMIRTRYRHQFGLGGVAESVEHAVALAPTHADALLMAAELARDQGEFPAARPHLQVAKEKHHRDWRIYQALAVVEMADNRLEEARKELAEGTRAVPEKEQAELQATLAELLLEGGKLDEAEKIIT